MDINIICQDFEKVLIETNRTQANQILNDYIITNKIQSFVEEIIVPSLESIGSQWEEGIISLSQVYMSSKICEQLMDKMLSSNVYPVRISPKIAIASLEDHHVLGKRIVKSVIQTAGYALMDLGQGISASELVEKVIREEIEILLISTLMYPSALKVKDVRREFKKQGKNIKILVGGAPYLVDANLWKQVGADAMGISAGDSLKILDQWVKGENQ